MAAVLQQESIGVKALRLRLSQQLTQRELASLAGVSAHDVNLLEHNLPLRLDTKRRLLKELWARKTQPHN